MEKIASYAAGHTSSRTCSREGLMLHSITRLADSAPSRGIIPHDDGQWAKVRRRGKEGTSVRSTQIPNYFETFPRVFAAQDIMEVCWSILASWGCLQNVHESKDQRQKKEITHSMSHQTSRPRYRMLSKPPGKRWMLIG